jgi:phosphotriesterase-related protein
MPGFSCLRATPAEFDRVLSCCPKRGPKGGETLINTVRGPVDGRDLGSTLMHEHVFVLSPEIEKTATEWDEQEAQATAVQRLRELKEHGIDTIVDLTVIGLGRFIPRIVAVASQVPEINIVVATGVYTYNEVPMYFHFRGPGTVLGGDEPMTEMFVREIREGIGDTGVRAGVLKCATDKPGITPGVERVLRAVAKAHRQTGTPITTHTPTPPEPWGLEQQRVLADEGVDLSQVVIGHSGGTLDTAYHLALLANGSYLGFDHFGIGYLSLDQRVESVRVLCELGHADRLVLSHDAMCHVDWFPPAVAAASKDWRWTHIPDDVLPAMRRAGISDEDIVTMMVENPRRILEGCEPY